MEWQYTSENGFVHALLGCCVCLAVAVGVSRIREQKNGIVFHRKSVILSRTAPLSSRAKPLQNIGSSRRS